MFTRSSLARATFALAMSFGSLLTCPAAAQERGSVYVMTNEASGNSILELAHDAAGGLSILREVYTGGLGSGGVVDPLHSQHGLVASQDRLLAVNAGSNQISLLSTGGHGLTLLDTVSSGGTFPSSVAVSDRLVYVLNARGTPSLTGFRITRHAALEMLLGSLRELPGGASAGPSDVAFDPDGKRLFVTETATNHIDVFEVGDDGRLGAVTTFADAGSAAFGFAFAGDDAVLVVEAASSSLSSYGVQDLGVISAAVPDGGKAACWVSATGSGRWAYVSNAATHTLSSYRIDGDGRLTLAEGVAADTGAGSVPIDSALSPDGRLLFVEDSLMGRVMVFRADGASLTPAGELSGLPTSVQGIAAR